MSSTGQRPYLIIRKLAALLFLLCVQRLSAQHTHPVFEVATVKAAPNADPNSGTWSPPGTGQFSATHVSLALLLQLAYGIDSS